MENNFYLEFGNSTNLVYVCIIKSSKQYLLNRFIKKR